MARRYRRRGLGRAERDMVEFLAGRGLAGATVLEIGGGTGQLSLALANGVASVLITDASAGMVEVARANIDAAGLTDRLTAQRLDLVTDPLPDDAFDGAWARALPTGRAGSGATPARRARI